MCLKVSKQVLEVFESVLSLIYSDMVAACSRTSIGTIIIMMPF